MYTRLDITIYLLEGGELVQSCQPTANKFEKGVQ